ncbi:MAG: cell filamentation protein Fic [Candidatus Competibacteraceae bacterium]|nr:cell filamentation protein Fic [Candidatus Competibacteraceae bacterium]
MSTPADPELPAQGQFLVYQAEDGRVKLEVRLEDETVWLSQQQLVDLFQSSRQNISYHIKTIYEEGELDPAATCKKYLQVRVEGAARSRGISISTTST